MLRLILIIFAVTINLEGKSYAGSLTRHADEVLKGGSEFYDSFAKATTKSLADDISSSASINRTQQLTPPLPLPPAQKNFQNNFTVKHSPVPDPARNVQTKINPKIKPVIERRGWTKEEIFNLTNGKAVHISPSRNNKNKPATAYFRADNHFVVKTNETGSVFQISPRHKKIVLKKEPGNNKVFAVDTKIIDPPKSIK